MNNSVYFIIEYEIKQPIMLNKTKLPLHFLNGKVCYYNISYTYKEIVDIDDEGGLFRVNALLKNITHKMINHFLILSFRPITKEKILEVLKEDEENGEEWVTVNPIF